MYSVLNQWKYLYDYIFNIILFFKISPQFWPGGGIRKKERVEELEEKMDTLVKVEDKQKLIKNDMSF